MSGVHPRPPSRTRVSTHGDAKEEQAEVREGGWEASRTSDEEAQEGIAATGTWRQGRTSDEPEAGDRDRIVGGAERRREGSFKAEVEQRAQTNRRPQEDGWSDKAEHEA